jgi:hypothetical protein
VNGKVRSAFQKRLFELFDKKTLAPDFVESDIENPVTLCGHAQ